MRSALADPYILGVSSGAAVGASLAVVFGGLTSARGFGVTLAAFATGLASVAAVYVAANVRGRVPAVRLLLAGVAWSSFSSAITGFILFLAPEAAQVRGVVFWLMGGLAGADWAGAGWTAAIALPCIVVLAATGRWQNLLLLGDEAALSLGLDVSSARGRLVVLASLATGAAVAFSGAIGFVGLVIPHVLRPLVGPDHRRLIPASVLAGALLLVWMDVLARTLLTPRELPVGLLTGLLGAPFFLLLLRRHHGEAD
jgi:iron complex transport system permease protein